MKKLFVVIRQGKIDEVKNIIEKKPELVNCVSGNYEIADYLISHGADVNFMEAEDDDPGLRAPVLFDAINATITSLCYKRVNESERALSYVKLLIEKGADVNRLASNGYDAMNWAVSKAELLFERASIYPDVQDEVRQQLAKILDLLIKNGADYIAWANRGHYAEPYPGPSNKSMFLDDFIPRDETDIDRTRNLRGFMQDYFTSRNLNV